MAIPKYNELFSIILKELSDRNEYKTRDLKEIITKNLDLTEEERSELLPSKKDTKINSNITWAISYLKHANYVESQKWGSVNITDFGLENFNKKQNITSDDLLEVHETISIATLI